MYKLTGVSKSVAIFITISLATVTLVTAFQNCAQSYNPGDYARVEPLSEDPFACVFNGTCLPPIDISPPDNGSGTVTCDANNVHALNDQSICCSNAAGGLAYFYRSSDKSCYPTPAACSVFNADGIKTATGSKSYQAGIGDYGSCDNLVSLNGGVLSFSFDNIETPLGILKGSAVFNKSKSEGAIDGKIYFQGVIVADLSGKINAVDNDNIGAIEGGTVTIYGTDNITKTFSGTVDFNKLTMSLNFPISQAPTSIIFEDTSTPLGSLDNTKVTYNPDGTGTLTGNIVDSSGGILPVTGTVDADGNIQNGKIALPDGSTKTLDGNVNRKDLTATFTIEGQNLPPASGNGDFVDKIIQTDIELSAQTFAGTTSGTKNGCDGIIKAQISSSGQVYGQVYKDGEQVCSVLGGTISGNEITDIALINDKTRDEDNIAVKFNPDDASGTITYSDGKTSADLHGRVESTINPGTNELAAIGACGPANKGGFASSLVLTNNGDNKPIKLTVGVKQYKLCATGVGATDYDNTTTPGKITWNCGNPALSCQAVSGQAICGTIAAQNGDSTPYKVLPSFDTNPTAICAPGSSLKSGSNLLFSETTEFCDTTDEGLFNKDGNCFGDYPKACTKYELKGCTVGNVSSGVHEWYCQLDGATSTETKCNANYASSQDQQRLCNYKVQEKVSDLNRYTFSVKAREIEPFKYQCQVSISPQRYKVSEQTTMSLADDFVKEILNQDVKTNVYGTGESYCASRICYPPFGCSCLDRDTRADHPGPRPMIVHDDKSGQAFCTLRGGASSSNWRYNASETRTHNVAGCPNGQVPDDHATTHWTDKYKLLPSAGGLDCGNKAIRYEPFPALDKDGCQKRNTPEIDFEDANGYVFTEPFYAVEVLSCETKMDTEICVFFTPRKFKYPKLGANHCTAKDWINDSTQYEVKQGTEVSNAENKFVNSITCDVGNPE